MTSSWGEGPNAETLEAWNGVLFDKFLRFKHVLTGGFRTHGEIAMARHAPPVGGRCLDIGCGFGDTTVALARRVGAGGEAVGQDGAARFIEAARADAAAAGVGNVGWLVGDAQTMDLGGPYDYVFSRMGVMFFQSPVVAWRNVRKAMRPGAELCVVVWRRREDNAFIHEAEKAVRAIIPPEAEKHDQPTCGPGPFSMVDCNVTSEQLIAAGFRDVSFDRVDAPAIIGRNLDEAVEFGMNLGPAGEVLRLAGEGAAPLRPRVQAALRDLFTRFQTADGVFAASSTWTISARA